MVASTYMPDLHDTIARTRAVGRQRKTRTAHDEEHLQLARALWDRGLSVIPVPRPEPNARAGEPGDGKVPAIAWRTYQGRQPTAAEIHGWFNATPQNLAVVTGAISGIVVVDADTPEALRWCVERLPYTPWQTQTARGFHLWYAHPGVRVPNRARIQTGTGRLAIDVRGDGGFVIAPGSLHASGVRYEQAGDWTVSRDQLPRFLPGWVEWRSLVSERLHSPAGARKYVTDAIARASRYLAAIPAPVIGQGSDAATLYAACRLVRGFALASDDAESLLWNWAGGRPGWTREWIHRKVRHAERYGTEPIGGLLS
jgi:hypothetical protein